MHVILNLLAGVALLAFAIYVTKKGVLKAFSYNINNSIKKALESKLWPVRAIISGVFTTILVQSSNATALLVSSFLSKGLINLTPALIIMLGADLGTAIIARILTFDISIIKPILILLGVFFYLYNHKTLAGRIGYILIGLGLVLLALGLIMDATRPVLEHHVTGLILQSINDIMPVAFIIGAILAIICYSSLAAVLLIAVTASTGALNIPTALMLVIGANMGSCVLEILGTLGSGIEARRVMVGNTLFKLTITLLVIPFIDVISKHLAYFNKILDSVLWFHVLFNLLICFGLLPFVNLYAKLLLILIQNPKEPNDKTKPKYLDIVALDTPSLAISNAIRETLRLGGYLHEMLYFLSKTIDTREDVYTKALDKAKQIESLGNNIKSYLNDIDFDNDEHLSIKWHQTLASIIYCMQGSDIMLRTQHEIAQLNNNEKEMIPAYSRSDLLKICRILNENLSFSLNAFMTGNDEDFKIVKKRKSEFKKLIDKYSLSQLTFLTQHSSSSADISAFVMMLLSQMRQLDNVFCAISISNFAKNKSSILDTLES